MSEINRRLEELRMAFGRLTQREQLMVLGGGAVALLIVLGAVGALVGGALSSAERRVKVKHEQLTEVVQLQGEYRAREQAQKSRLRSLRSSGNVRLVKLVEDAARNAGVDIGQLSPEDGEPNDEGIYESRVDLRASNLSIDRLQDFLSRLEGPSAGLLFVRRMRINKPYRKETLELDLEIVAYRVKG